MGTIAHRPVWNGNKKKTSQTKLVQEKFALKSFLYADNILNIIIFSTIDNNTGQIKIKHKLFTFWKK